MPFRPLSAALLASISLSLAAAPALRAEPPAPQATTAPTAMSQEDMNRIVQEVRKKISGLTTLSVFDWLTFGIQGRTLILQGYASRPVLKDDAARAVKNIEGVESVKNNIEVLPLSPSDDRVRAAVYNRIYTQGQLRKYNANQGSLGQAMGPGGPSLAARAGGITNDPPIGYHAIHIIVKNGQVTLYGDVLNQGDSNLAYIQANSAPGAFKITNNLTVQGAPSTPEK